MNLLAIIKGTFKVKATKVVVKGSPEWYALKAEAKKRLDSR